jgi:short-subunit dehydrogenase
MELDDTTILVTGANRGIGRALTAELAGRGARVLAGVRDLDAKHRGGVPDHDGVDVVRMDLSSRETITASLDELGPRADDIDILVNNAGLYAGGLLERHDPEQMYDVVQANLTAPMHLTRALLSTLRARDQAKVVNNTSIAGYAQFPGSTVYGASKAGLAGFSDALRRELDDTPVSVLNLVTPGIDTEMMDEVESSYRGHADADGWGHVEPEEWAEKVADAIEDDKDELRPGGAEGVAKLMSRGPGKMLDAVAGRVFSR